MLQCLLTGRRPLWVDWQHVTAATSGLGGIAGDGQSVEQLREIRPHIRINHLNISLRVGVTIGAAAGVR